jgi:malonyl CoA-acyl carrier protein transacylase/acyl carrier protein
VEQPPIRATVSAAPADGRWHLLTTSASSAASLAESCERYRTHIEANPAPVAAIVASATRGRMLQRHRAAILVRSSEDAVRALGSATDPLRADAVVPPETSAPEVCFLFPGQGVVRTGAGAQLYREESAFHRAVDACCAALMDSESAEYVSNFFRASTTLDAGEPVMHPLAPVLSFTFQYAAVALLSEWGLSCQAVLGHSVGEYAAAVTAGLFPLESAVRCVHERSRLMVSLTGSGGMLSVLANPEDVRRVLGEECLGLEIAAVNLPNAIVLSGPEPAVREAEQILAQQRIVAHRLAIPHACHSRWMEPMLEPYRTFISRVGLASPRIAVFPAAAKTQAADMQTHDYWVQQIRRPVHFHEALVAATASGVRAFVEIGSAPMLAPLGRRASQLPELFARCLLEGKAGEAQAVAKLVRDLHLRGVATDTRLRRGLHGSRAYRLPAYPFDRRVYFQRPSAAAVQTASDFDRVVEAGRECAERGTQLLELQSLAHKHGSASRFTDAALARALSRLLPAHLHAPTEALEPELLDGVVPASFQPLLRAWLALLRRSDAPELSLVSESVEREYAWARQSALDAFGSEDPYAAYMIGCGDVLAEVVTGKIAVLETLFPRGDFHIVDMLYRTGPVARYFNGLASALTRAVTAQYPGRRIKALEIGAGTGGFTSAVYPELCAHGVDYTFTDITDFFFARARAQFGGTSLRFELFDVEQAPPERLRRSAPYDILFASNVLHATRDLERTLAHCSELLAEGGWLVLNELTRNDPWLAITAGLIEGWQKYSDEWRTQGPLISADSWTRLLRKCGFVDVAAMPSPDNAASALGQHIVVARWGRQRGVRNAADEIDSAGAHRTDSPPVAIAVEPRGAWRAKLQTLEPGLRKETLIHDICRRLAGALGEPSVAPDRGFFDLGLDSLKAVDLAARLSDLLEISLPAPVLFDRPTAEALSDELLRLAGLDDAIAEPELATLPSESELVRQLREKLGDPPN